MYNEESWWPTLRLQPINLWSAPYIGRPFKAIEIKDPEIKKLESLPKLRLALSIKTIMRNR